MEQEYTVLDPFTGLPPGVFAAGVPIYVPGAGGGGGSWPAASHHSYESESPWGSPCDGTVPLASGSPGSGGSCGGALAASLSALPGGAAAAARLLLQAHAQPQHPRGSPAARRARQLSELHMRACIKAGLRYAGSACAASCCDCWTYRIGPCAGGLEAGDQLCVSRFLLRRLGEELSVDVGLKPRPCSAQHGSTAPGLHAAAAAAACHGGPGGCSTEFSTAASRAAPDGICEMQRMISRLQAAHPRHSPGFAGAATAASGSAASSFSVAVGDRRAAIVIPTSALVSRSGAFVDRRPAGDCDPYLSTALLAAGALGLPLPPLAEKLLAMRQPPSAHSRASALLMFKPAHAAPTCGATPGGDSLRAAAALNAAAAAARQQPAAFGAAAQPLSLQHDRSASFRGSFGGIPFGGAGVPCTAASPAMVRWASGGPAPRVEDAMACCDNDEGDVSGADDDFSEEGEASEEMLISEICRIDRQAARRGRPGKLVRCGESGAGLGAEGGARSEDDGDEDFDESEGEEEDSASSLAAGVRPLALPAA
jgi:hypothetical protein